MTNPDEAQRDDQDAGELEEAQEAAAERGYQ